MKLCIDCKYHKPKEMYPAVSEDDYCLYGAKKAISPVTGAELYIETFKSCKIQRESTAVTHCGPKGDFFSPKEVSDNQAASTLPQKDGVWVVTRIVDGELDVTVACKTTEGAQKALRKLLEEEGEEDAKNYEEHFWIDEHGHIEIGMSWVNFEEEKE